MYCNVKEDYLTFVFNSFCLHKTNLSYRLESEARLTNESDRLANGSGRMTSASRGRLCLYFEDI